MFLLLFEKKMAAKFPLISGQEIRKLAEKLLKGLAQAVLGNFVLFC